MDLYPLELKPVYKEKIWGGTKLNQVFNRQLPADNIGESWEVTAHPNGKSIIQNGHFHDQKITTLIKRFPAKMLGHKFAGQTDPHFPLLIKYIDANTKLSVQVHPGDKYAQKTEGEPGKTEMWYIIDAKPGAKLIYGLKPETTKEDFSRGIKEGKLEKYLNEIKVQKGDVLFIPTGTVHAIEEGILLAEILQNSDTTYRVYDWNRTGKDGKPRPLHINKALDVINFEQNLIASKCKPLVISKKEYTRGFLAGCPYFATEKINVKDKFEINPAGKRFYALMVLSGEGDLIYKNTQYHLSPGKTYFLPAELDRVKIEGQIETLLAYHPDSKKQIIERLLTAGLKKEQINQLTGIKNWK